MSEENTELSFFGIDAIKYYTTHIHGYLSVTICTIGVIANIINMIIFTRKRMVSPINLILASLSFADFFALLNYYYKAWYFYIKPGANPYVYWYLSHTTARLMQWQLHFAHIFINIGVWLTALVSIWRYVAIAFPLKNLYWGNNKTTCKAIALVVILCLLFYTPALIAKRVLAITYDELNLTIYLVSFNQTDPLSTYMADADHFIYSICFRFLPSIVIAVLSARLLLIFAKMSENRKKLSASANSNPASLKKEKQMARTTLVLIILSILCFVTQLPQYILGLSSYFLSVNRHYQYENVLKEIFDILELTNSAIGFFIYLTISEQFRETFKILFHLKSEQQKSVISTSGHANQGYSSNQSVDLATASTNV